MKYQIKNQFRILGKLKLKLKIKFKNIVKFKLKSTLLTFSTFPCPKFDLKDFNHILIKKFNYKLK